MSGHDVQHRVWRKPSTVYEHKYLKAAVSTVLERWSLGHRTVTESTVYSSVHQSMLSRTIAWKWVIQQNNDPHHSNTFTTEWLKKIIKMLQWPSQSAELNPTNMLWCRFKRAVHKQMNQSDLHIIVVQNSSTIMWGNKVLLMNITAQATESGHALKVVQDCTEWKCYVSQESTQAAWI